MAMKIRIRQAGVPDIGSILGILTEAAEWLHSRGIPMWCDHELDPERIAEEAARGDFFVAESGGGIVGTFKFQLEDRLFWPDLPAGEAAFVHRFAIHRGVAGSGVSTAMLQWAADRAAQSGRRFLRLDCDAARPSLRAFYETFGFRYHSNRQVGPYHVARYEYPVG